MGMLCPICLTHQAFKRSITVDGKGAERADQVIARELACGHVIGGEEYRKFLEAVWKIDRETTDKVIAIQETAKGKKAAAYKTLIAPRGND